MTTVRCDTSITCPACQHTGRLTLREGIRHDVLWCPVCGAKLTPPPGECCVPCAYGTLPCLPVQRASMLALESERFWRLVDADREA